MTSQPPNAAAPRPAGKKTEERGVVLFSVLIFSIILAIIVSSQLMMGNQALRTTRTWDDMDECVFAAQSVLEKTKWDIQSSFLEYFTGTSSSYVTTYTSGAQTSKRLDWFGNDNSGMVTRIGKSGCKPVTLPSNTVWVNGAKVTITATGPTTVGKLKRYTFKAAAAKGNTSRTVTEIVDFGMAQSSVFDYAYFINNWGWFYSSVTANGDVRANGVFTIGQKGGNASSVNGSLYASDTVTINSSLSRQTLSAYFNTGNTAARPGSPTNLTSTGYAWPMGYTGTGNQYSDAAELPMPYIGDMTDYEMTASAANSYVRTGTLQYDEVYSGAGPDGVAGTVDDGMAVLVGTSASPIQIDGPVVFDGDVIIRGVVSGQGTIYSKRNIYIIGDITYSTAPTWSKSSAGSGKGDSNAIATASSNKSASALGLAAKGNIVVGNYMNTSSASGKITYNAYNTSGWISGCKTYMTSTASGGAVKPYATIADDAVLGYDSDNNSANGYQFNGDYTAFEATGAKKITMTTSTKNSTGTYIYSASGAYTATSLVARRYFDCTNEEAYIRALYTNGSPSTVTNVNAIMYTNHLICGVMSSNFKINGCVISRDEAINGGGQMNWDIRAGSSSRDASGVDMYLPLTVVNPRTRYWRE